MPFVKSCCGLTFDRSARCAISGCLGQPSVQIHHSDLAQAQRLFFGLTGPRSKRSVRQVYLCERHLHQDSRSSKLRWQGLLFPV
jgi:hypothetical protein